MYLARDARLGRTLALKLLPRLDIADDETTVRFLRETRAASALNHPNIVRIFDIGEDGANRFIVMEFVHGRVLRGVVPPALEPTVAPEVGAQIARALDVAHAAGSYTGRRIGFRS